MFLNFRICLKSPRRETLVYFFHPKSVIVLLHIMVNDKCAKAERLNFATEQNICVSNAIYEESCHKFSFTRWSFTSCVAAALFFVFKHKYYITKIKVNLDNVNNHFKLQLWVTIMATYTHLRNDITDNWQSTGWERWVRNQNFKLFFNAGFYLCQGVCQ